MKLQANSGEGCARFRDSPQKMNHVANFQFEVRVEFGFQVRFFGFSVLCVVDERALHVTLFLKGTFLMTLEEILVSNIYCLFNHRRRSDNIVRAAK